MLLARSEFEMLIEQHYPRIRRAAVLLTGNSWEAEDLAQETFLQAMQSLSRFDKTSRVETWLYGILVNLDRKRRRRHVRGWRQITTWFLRKSVDSDHQSPSELIESRERRQGIWDAVAELSEHQQHAIVLRYAEGLSYQEIAEVMGCPAGTIKSRLHHGLTALKNKLGTSLDDELDDLSRCEPCCGARR